MSPLLRAKRERNETMDPNETLRMIDSFLTDRETGECVDEWCENLMEWLSRGGFEPEWEKYPLGASYYQCRLVSTPEAG